MQVQPVQDRLPPRIVEADVGKTDFAGSSAQSDARRVIAFRLLTENGPEPSQRAASRLHLAVEVRERADRAGKQGRIENEREQFGRRHPSGLQPLARDDENEHRRDGCGQPD